MAPPTESEILTQYLLTSARLPSFLTLQDFIALFPRNHQSSPLVRSLYRDLQAQRNDLVDSVEANIADEVRAGKRLRREILHQRLEAEADELDDEVAIERILFGDESGIPTKNRALRQAVPELESTLADMVMENRLLEEEEERLMGGLKQTIGSLSDLRYGKLSNPQLQAEVLEGLKHVEETCNGDKHQ